MKKWSCFAKLVGCGIVCTFILTGCFGRKDMEKEPAAFENETKEEPETAEPKITEPKITEPKITEPKIIEADWSEYFDGLSGAAVIYDASALQFTLFQRELALARRSPCSTFKIISSLVALENGIIEPDDSIHKWSGEVFWNENWNRDIDFREAFRESCVWYGL